MASLPQPATTTDPPFVGAGKTDVGRRRSHNEDQILVAEEIGLFAVADGMGGHQAGDVASSIASATLEEYFWTEQEIDPTLPGVEGLEGQAARLVCAVHRCNREVFSRSGRSANQGGMGSTVVALLLDPPNRELHIVHVGDSRCYRVRGGEIQLLTEDHSMINEALRLNPDLSPEILAQLPSNVVTRALGTKEDVQPDVRSEPMRAGDVYILCSDGLSGEVSDEDILLAVLQSDELEEACEHLVGMANEAGGRDNISAVLVRIEGDPDEDPDALVVVDDGDESDASDGSLDWEDDHDTSVEVDFSIDEANEPAAALSDDELAAIAEDAASAEEELAAEATPEPDSGPGFGEPSGRGGDPSQDAVEAALADPDLADPELDDEDGDYTPPPLDQDLTPTRPAGMQVRAAKRTRPVAELQALDYEEETDTAPGRALGGVTRSGAPPTLQDLAKSVDAELGISREATPYRAMIARARRNHSLGDAAPLVMPVLGLGTITEEAPPEKITPRCVECGHKLLPEETFCGMCGCRVGDEEEDEMVARCDACGYEILLGTRYCVECGVRHGF